MKNVLDKNFPVALKHVDSNGETDIFLTEVNAKMNSIKMNVVPMDHDENGWDKIDSDLFFDQGQIVTEINGLMYKGTG